MCGIVGFAGEGKRETLEKMNSTLVYRGPDEDGYFFIEGELGFGFRRLAIIDLAGGNQPLFNEDQSIVSMLNGEIYNFKELRQDLAKRHKLVTQGDTEVIPHLYEEIGEKLFEKLNGMFAIAIFDRKNKKLILARDRFGKKPLFYAILNQTLIFASEPKAILEYPGIKRELNPQALNLYLIHEYVPCPWSIFRGIKKIEPGSFLVFQNGRIQKDRRYYEIEFNRRDLEVKFQDPVKELDRRLEEAVQKRLVADVPLGLFLSGGLDSSTVCYFAQRLQDQKIKTFSVGFKDQSFDESKYARQVAEVLKSEHHEKILEAEDLYSLAPQIFKMLDEPLADAAIIPNFLLSRFARQSVTVALGGDGGDEIFMGYPTFQAHRLFDFYRFAPDFLKNNLVEPIINHLPASFANITFDYKLKRFILGLKYGPERRDSIWIGSFTPEEKQKLLTPEILKETEGFNDFSVVDRYMGEVAHRPFLEKIAYLYQKTYMTDDILALKDRASMFVSLELRAPLLDVNVVDFVNSLPQNLKLRGFKTKYLLKELMRGRLPQNIIDRSKKGFGIPVARWLRGELKSLMLEVLDSKKLAGEGIFQPKTVELLISEHLSGKKDNRKLLWTLMAFELWRKNWLKN